MDLLLFCEEISQTAIKGLNLCDAIAPRRPKECFSSSQRRHVAMVSPEGLTIWTQNPAVVENSHAIVFLPINEISSDTEILLLIKYEEAKCLITKVC